MRHAWVLLLAFIVLAPAVPTHAASDGGAAEQLKLVERIRARLDASAQGDAARWATFVDNDCICGLETKAAIQHAIATRLPSVKNWYGEILDLRLRFLGETAVARYRITEHTEVGGQHTSLQEWRTEIYARRKEGWILIAGADTVISPEPTVVKVDPRIFDGYTGKYQYAPGLVDTVTREGDRLFIQPSGEPRVELFAESETTYFAKGEPWRLIFMKDPHGAVTALVLRQQGQEWTAVKVP